MAVQLRLSCIWHPLPRVRSLAPTWATAVKHTGLWPPLSALQAPRVSGARPIAPAIQWLPRPPPAERVPQRQSVPLLRAANPIISRAESTAPRGHGSSQPGCLPSRGPVRARPGARSPAAEPPPARARCPLPGPRGPHPTCRLQQLLRRPARMKSSCPGGSPHCAPAAGGEGPPPAAGRGSWGARPPAATPPRVRVISYENAGAGGAPRACGPREGSRGDCPCKAPASARAPVPRAAWTAPSLRAGFPTQLTLPVGIVHFAEFEVGLSFQVNVQRIRHVINGHPFLEAPGARPTLPRRVRTAPPLTRVEAGTSGPLAYVMEGEPPPQRRSERQEEAERGRPRICGCSAGHLVDRCSL